MSSIYAIVKSRTTNTYIQSAALIKENRNVVLKGNKSMTSGVKGERKWKTMMNCLIMNLLEGGRLEIMCSAVKEQSVLFKGP